METIILGKMHHVSPISFAVLADKRLQHRDCHQSPFKETNRTVTQFCPFSFTVPGMVQTLPKRTGTVPFHSLVSVKHVS